MNFEEKPKGWNVIFEGMISPFANRFKKYVHMELNANIYEDNIQSENEDEEMIGNSLLYFHHINLLICFTKRLF